jgi:DNA-directed RNA polymerase III subunit RPC4
MGSRGGISRSVVAASGPFSAGATGSGRSFARIGGGGFSGGGGGGGGGSRSWGSGAAKSEHKGSADFAQTDEDHVREARINADRLHGLGADDEVDEDDHAIMQALIARSTSIMPMGIYRREHKEAEVVVATTAELEAAEQAAGEEESLWVDGEAPNSEIVMDQPEEQGVWGKATGGAKAPRIKKEPDTETQDTMDIDAADGTPTDKEAQSDEAAVKPKPKKVALHDPEEDMIHSDLNLLANELGSATITEEDDGEETTTQTLLDKDGRMYLFQFPPLLPPLQPTREPTATKKSKVKPEPHDLDMHDALAQTTSTNPVDLTTSEEGGATTGAAENGRDQEPAVAVAAAGENDDPEKTRGFMSELLSQGGMIGKLNIRKSGKTELDWGGRILELSPAAGMNFLTTAVIVEENDTKPQPGMVGGDGIGMGKIMGRFVLAPTWDEEEEWNVSPEELEMN